MNHPDNPNTGRMPQTRVPDGYTAGDGFRPASAWELRLMDEAFRAGREAAFRADLARINEELAA